jgi:hypothetical protein
MDRKKRIHTIFYLLAAWLITISCKLSISNPMSGIADALKNMFESIGKSITINF